eukprot:COSAG02_NODE_1641_length_11530_cov_4.345289_1_plen_54_part_10
MIVFTHSMAPKRRVSAPLEKCFKALSWPRRVHAATHSVDAAEPEALDLHLQIAP